MTDDEKIEQLMDLVMHLRGKLNELSFRVEAIRQSSPEVAAIDEAEFDRLVAKIRLATTGDIDPL